MLIFVIQSIQFFIEQIAEGGVTGKFFRPPYPVYNIITLQQCIYFYDYFLFLLYKYSTLGNECLVGVLSFLVCMATGNLLKSPFS